jgi:hypothetical protein
MSLFVSHFSAVKVASSTSTVMKLSFPTSSQLSAFKVASNSSVIMRLSLPN